MKAKTIAVFVMAGLVLIILLQNTKVISLRFFFWELSMSQVILLPLIMLAGFLAGFFVARLRRH